jgi:hypothetical protein
MTSGEEVVIVAVILVGVLILAGFVSAFFLLAPVTTVSRTATSQPSTVTITGFILQISYADSSNSYFGPSTQSLTGTSLPLQVQRGQEFTYSFKLAMAGIAETSHSVDGLALTTPGFTLVTVSPTLPFTFFAGSSATFIITGEAPNYDFTGAPTLVLSTH